MRRSPPTAHSGLAVAGARNGVIEAERDPGSPGRFYRRHIARHERRIMLGAEPAEHLLGADIGQAMHGVVGEIAVDIAGVPCAGEREVTHGAGSAAPLQS